MTAVGILTRIFLGENPKESRMIKKGADQCLKIVPVWDTEDGSIDMYYWYYGSLALYQVGGNAWKTWSKAMVPCILKNQFPKGSGARTGSWDPIGPWGPDGGRVYATAMMVLCLETPYRYRRVHSVRPQLTKSVLEALRAAARDEDKVLAQAAAESLAAIGSE